MDTSVYPGNLRDLIDDMDGNDLSTLVLRHIADERVTLEVKYKNALEFVFYVLNKKRRDDEIRREEEHRNDLVAMKIEDMDDLDFSFYILSEIADERNSLGHRFKHALRVLEYYSTKYPKKERANGKN